MILSLKLRSLLLVMVLATFSRAAGPTTADAVADRVQHHLAPHPRLLLTDAQFAALQQQILVNPHLAKLRDRVLLQADLAIKLPKLEHTMTGKRLLAVSRDALARIATLSLAFRLTHDRKYFDAARSDLLTVCAFEDFGPVHFLDVAEMTAATAIGYDWLFDTLSVDDRAIIRKATVDKALLRPLDHETWVRGMTNWNQVCHGGLTLGALSIADEEPQLAQKVISRAVECVPFGMHAYEPDGVYPEGPGYWEYGTSYNTLMIAALNSALGDDFGLAGHPGYLKSSDFHLHTVGPSGLLFAYSDCNLRANAPSAAAFYMAQLRNDPYLLLYESRLLDALLKRPPAASNNFDWLTLIWAHPSDDIKPPTTQSFVGNGVTPIATFRSSWQDDAVYLAVKGGAPSNGHGHMDVGEFVIDADGLRWAADLGLQGYSSLESRNVDIWNSLQNSQRWQVFRIGPMSHNILTVDGQDQRVDGHANIIRSGEQFAIIDLTPVYAGQLAAVQRGAMLRTDRSVRIEDEITAPPDRAVTVQFGLTTAGKPEVGAHNVMLSQKGKKMLVRVSGPSSLSLAAAPADPPPHDYDATNPGVNRLMISIKIAAGEKTTLAVDFCPGVSEPDSTAEPIVPLDRW